MKQDVKLFFVIANSMRDAGIMTWNAIYYYRHPTYVRTIIKLGELGLIRKFDRQLRGCTSRAYNAKENSLANTSVKIDDVPSSP